MSRFRVILAAFGIGLGSGSPAALATDTGNSIAPAAWITLLPEDDGLRLTADVAAIGNFEGRADLTVLRTGRAGTAKTRQGQTVSLTAGERTTVATSHLSFAPGDALDATLTLRDASGTVVAHSTVTIDKAE